LSCYQLCCQSIKCPCLFIANEEKFIFSFNSRLVFREKTGEFDEKNSLTEQHRSLKWENRKNGDLVSLAEFAQSLQARPRYPSCRSSVNIQSQRTCVLVLLVDSYREPVCWYYWSIVTEDLCVGTAGLQPQRTCVLVLLVYRYRGPVCWYYWSIVTEDLCVGTAGLQVQGTCMLVLLVDRYSVD
jgi:hypothetical protein